MAYSKLFSSIVHSSLWTEEDHVRLLFVTLLAIADREGFVYGSRRGLERLANIISENRRDPWEVLMSPDSDSSDLMRNPENEGRRIEQVQGGFQILNYSYYRSLRNDDDRRQQNRKAQRRHREKISTSKPKSSQDKPASAIVSQDKQIPSASASSSKSACTQKEAEEYCISIGLPRSDGKAMFLHWQEKGWSKVKDWKLTIQKWQSFGYLPSQKKRSDKFGKDDPKPIDKSKIEVPERFKAWVAERYPDHRAEAMRWHTWRDVPSNGLREEWWKEEKSKLPVEI